MITWWHYHGLLPTVNLKQTQKARAEVDLLYTSLVKLRIVIRSGLASNEHRQFHGLLVFCKVQGFLHFLENLRQKSYKGGNFESSVKMEKTMIILFLCSTDFQIDYSTTVQIAVAFCYLLRTDRYIWYEILHWLNPNAFVLFFLLTQCNNGHLMCAGCFTHLLADSRLKDEQPTCPNCRCEISKNLCSRNLAVEKAVSELPAGCRYCNCKLPRYLLDQHERQGCKER